MRFKSISLFLIPLWATIFILGCPKSDKGKTSTLKEIDYARALKMINSQNPPVIIDVRTAEEFNGELGHIPNARLIPIQSIPDSISVFEQFKGRDILLVCRSGRRSKMAGDELVKAGVANVYDLTGGMIKWNEKGGPVEKNSE